MLTKITRFIAATAIPFSPAFAFAHPGHGAAPIHIHGGETTLDAFSIGSMVVIAAAFVIAFAISRRQPLHSPAQREGRMQ